MLIQCFEPQGQPRKIAIDPGPTQRFCIYAIQDLLGEETKGLRVTVLRHPDQAPPPHSQFVVELEVRRRRANEGPSFRVTRVGHGVTLEWLRHDGRSRVTLSTDLKDGSRFEVTLPDMRTVIFALEAATEVEQGAAAGVGGKGRRSSAAAAGSVSAYVVPAVAAMMADPATRVKGAMINALRRLGLSPAVAVPLLLTLTMMIAALAVTGWSLSSQASMSEELEEAKAKKQQAEAGRDAALLAESACIEERKAIASALDEVTEARKLQAEVALAVPMAQAIAVELGGKRMASEEALEFDQVAMKNTRGYVVNAMGKKRPALSDPQRCRGQAGVLGQDLPEYVLLWNPKPEYQCPEDFAMGDGAVDRKGPWGLSSRAAEEFGAPQNLVASPAAEFGEAPEDPRMNPRWSAHAMAVGLREILTTVLEADTGDRPPVAPGQAHLWSLAIWDAYNSLPSPAEGVMDKTAEECVQDLMDQVIKASGPAEPGQPVLPDISLVALGESAPALLPSSGCPWPSDALSKGATNATEAVTRLAIVLMEQEGEG